MDILNLPKLKEPKITVKFERTFAYWFAEHLLVQLGHNPELASLIAEVYNLFADRINQSTKPQVKFKMKRHHANLVLQMLSGVVIADPYYNVQQQEVINQLHQKLISHEIPVIEQ